MSIKTFKKTILGFIVLYFAIFLARAVYDIITFKETDAVDNYNIYYVAEKDARSVSNYASEQMVYNVGGAEAAVLDQKYERIASIISKTVNYDADMEHFNAILDEHKAVIQMENRRGLPGGRRADFTIGVRPEAFDAMQEAISRIGAIVSSSVIKTDKTYEYRQMLAEKETLERRRASYEELRKFGGSIPDLLSLEDKIIEVESQIQQQLIGLGEYSDDNALCTINYTLYEGSEAGTLRKLWNALKWSTATYAIILCIVIFTAIAARIFVWSWSKIKETLADKPATPATPVTQTAPTASTQTQAPKQTPTPVSPTPTSVSGQNNKPESDENSNNTHK